MARSEYIQHVVRPGSWSPAGFMTAVVVILVDMFFVGQSSPNREDIGMRFTFNPDKSRRIVAFVYLAFGILSAYMVMDYQEQYFVDVGNRGLRPEREMPQSIYPWLYELVPSQCLFLPFVSY